MNGKTGPGPAAGGVVVAPAAGRDLAAAAAEYLAALNAELDKPIDEADFTAPGAALTSAFEPAGISVTEVLTAADEALAKSRRPRTYDDGLRRKTARTRLAPVGHLLDKLLFRFDGQAELDAAEQDHARLVEERADLLGQLEDAVNGADIGEVTRLRPLVEVDLPVKIGQAELRVADLRVARAEAEQQQVAGRYEPLAAASIAAEQDVRDAWAAFEDAQRRAGTATALAAQARGSLNMAASRTDALRDERDQLAETVSGQQERLLRRLAGLPERQPASPEQPARPLTLRRPTVQAVT